MANLNDIEVGDRIEFRAPTRGLGGRKAVRKVKHIIPSGYVVVAYAGWVEFMVRPEEVIRVWKEEDM